MEGGQSGNNSINEEENPRNNSDNDDRINSNNNNDDEGRGGSGRRRTPFADLSQVEADRVLALTLQEQERLYMRFRMNGGGEGSDYGSWEAGSYRHGDEDDDDFDDPSEEEYEGHDAEEDDDEEDGEEDAFDVHEHYEAEEDENQNFEIDPSAYSSDEAYARALQDAENMAARLLAMARINDIVVAEHEDEENHGGNAEEAWEDVDPDELSYEELLALGEVVGSESRGLSPDTIASLPSMNYKLQNAQNGSSDSCVICRVDYEDGETLTVLSCKHSYHSECINNWLQINKVCPVCSAEVCTS